MSSSGSSGSHLHDPFSDSTPAILASAHPDAVTDFLQLVDDREAAFFHARWLPTPCKRVMQRMAMVGMLAVVQGRYTCLEMFMEGHAKVMVGLPLRAGWSGWFNRGWGKVARQNWRSVAVTHPTPALSPRHHPCPRSVRSCPLPPGRAVQVP